VHLVDPPRLYGLDRPYPQDGPDFEKRLASALQNYIELARQEHVPDMESLAQRLESYTWPGIFEKVLAAYNRVLN
jgi:hypothetical protein